MPRENTLVRRTQSHLDNRSLREKLGYEKWEEGIDCSNMPSMTQQEFAYDCDINNIIERATRGEAIGMQDTSLALYGDFSDVDDYHTMMNKIISAQEAFQELPVNIKKRFDQDPGKLIDFLNNPENREEAERLGLVNKKTVPPILQSEEKKDPATTGSATSPT